MCSFLIFLHGGLGAVRDGLRVPEGGSGSIFGFSAAGGGGGGGFFGLVSDWDIISLTNLSTVFISDLSNRRGGGGGNTERMKNEMLNFSGCLILAALGSRHYDVTGGISVYINYNSQVLNQFQLSANRLYFDHCVYSE